MEGSVIESPTASGNATRGFRRWWRLAALLVVGAALTALTYSSWTGLRHDLRAVDSDLATTGASLDSASLKLVRRYNALAAARADLADSRDDLRRRTEQRNTVEGRVIAARAALEETDAQIGDRSTELLQREANLALLGRCFVGASEALNQIAVADITGFGATLREVSNACSSARSYL